MPETALVRMDPHDLIAKAIGSGASVETLERLVSLAKDVRQTTAREAWFEAMSEFQRRCPAIKKDATAKIVSQRGGSYSYSYATLPTILEIVEPLLGELGLSLSWRQKHEGQAVSASCVVSHKLGHQEESGFITMPYTNDGGRMNPAQAVGSALTYARRYSLLAILGLAPEDDDDARSAGNGESADWRRGEDKSRRHAGGGGAAPSETSSRADDVSAGSREASDGDGTIGPTKVAELFPDPEKEKMLLDCQTLITSALKAKKATPQDVRDWKRTYLGKEDADPRECDKAALSDLRGYLRLRYAPPEEPPK